MHQKLVQGFCYNYKLFQQIRCKWMFSFLLHRFCCETDCLSKQPFIADLKYGISQNHSKHLKNVSEEFHVLVKLFTILLKINPFTLLLSIFLILLWNFKCISFGRSFKELYVKSLYLQLKSYLFFETV